MSGSTPGYRNPVLSGFHPDPSVCRVGGDYFLAASSFTCFPGVPIFRSTDLVHWTPIGNALDRTSQLDLSGTETYASAGVFAPTLRYHDGRFWMITSVFGRRLDNFFVTAEDPAGPWSDPVRVAFPGIDPDLAWDDGDCWVHSAQLAIHRCRIDDRTGAVLTGPERTWSGTGLQYPEAPHLFRRDGVWYLLIAEGGTERGHAVSIARGPAPTGPWEGCPANPILSHRSTDRPIQSTGHADLVEAPDGSWWMVLLGTRLRGVTPMFHVLGRETFLVPVDWVDGWPVPRDLALAMPFAPPGPDTSAPAAARDDAAALGPRWVSVRGPLGQAATLGERPGWLVLHGRARGLDDPWPVFVGQRQQHLRCRARTLVEAGSAEAGLAVRMDERHHYAVSVVGGAVAVRAQIGPLASEVARAPAPGAAVVLRIETHDDPARLGAGPDRVRLGYERADGSFEVMADLDGRYVSTEVAGGFIGRTVGLYARSGTAAFDWFELADRDS
jgi:xylan 1,4-beta-xylosidase